MKTKIIVALVLLACAGPLSAQTCADPATASWPSLGGATLSGTTCDADTTAPSYCAGNFDAPGPAYVIQSTFDGTRTFTNLNLNGGQAGFDPVIYVTPVSAGCGTDGPCIATGDSSANILSADVPDGDWFIIVTAATINAPGACGDFALASDGNVPVELHTFEII